MILALAIAVVALAAWVAFLHLALRGVQKHHANTINTHTQQIIELTRLLQEPQRPTRSHFSR